MSEQVVIVGFGWVGQANAIALCQMGYSVSSYDVLQPVRHYASHHAETYDRIAALPHPLAVDGDRTWYIVCVGDKSLQDGSQDIAEIESALESLRGAAGKIILRSTILPGRLTGLAFDFYIPEFLHEKTAVQDAVSPRLLAIGENSETELPQFIADWAREADKVFIGTAEEAAHIKYLCNLWNATQVAFVNEMATAIAPDGAPESRARAERVIDFVFERRPYLRFGKAFGGRCLTKDIRASIEWSQRRGVSAAILEGVWAANVHHGMQPEHGSLPEWFFGHE
jgi:UDP-glucose 6-dehydrogenase